MYFRLKRKQFEVWIPQIRGGKKKSWSVGQENQKPPSASDRESKTFMDQDFN